MSGKLITLLALVASTLCFVSVAHGREDFAGKYEGDNLSVEIAADGGGYAGQIHLGQQQFPFKAREDAGRIHARSPVRATTSISHPASKAMPLLSSLAARPTRSSGSR